MSNLLTWLILHDSRHWERSWGAYPTRASFKSWRGQLTIWHSLYPISPFPFLYIHDPATLLSIVRSLDPYDLFLTLLRESFDYFWPVLCELRKLIAKYFPSLSREKNPWASHYLALLLQMPKQKAPKKQLKSYKLKHINRTIQGTSDFSNSIWFSFSFEKIQSFHMVLWLKMEMLCWCVRRSLGNRRT